MIEVPCAKLHGAKGWFRHWRTSTVLPEYRLTREYANPGVSLCHKWKVPKLSRFRLNTPNGRSVS